MPEFLPGRSYCYTGVIDATILKKNKVEPIDLIETDIDSIGVKELRAIITQALTRPFGTHRLLWLRGAESTSLVNQNTLLKILEEPPASLIIVVEAQNIDRFLPTVRSRLTAVQSSKANNVTDAVIPVLADQREKFLRSFTDREELSKALEQERNYQVSMLLTNPRKESSQRIALLEKTIQRLGINTNLKLAIDSFLLHWPSE